MKSLVWKSLVWSIPVALAGLLALAAAEGEADQLKSDLIGHSMGGREKCWKFQSVEQIRELAIQTRSEESHRRVYTVSLRLQANQTSPLYAAQARVEYTNTTHGWQIQQVGLLSLAKLETP